MSDTVSQTVLFPDLFDKPLVATFDQQHASSDGGAVLLKAAERQYDVIEGFAQCLVDARQPGKVRHTLEDLLGQRIFGIACGHPDANDADGLAEDPSTSCCSGGTRSRATRSPPNRPSRGLRTTSGARRPLWPGAGAGDECGRAASPTASRAGSADHDRSRPDRRRNPRRAAAHLLQRLLRQLVLPAVARVSDLRRRSRAVSRRGRAAPGATSRPRKVPWGGCGACWG